VYVDQSRFSSKVMGSWVLRKEWQWSDLTLEKSNMPLYSIAVCNGTGLGIFLICNLYCGTIRSSTPTLYDPMKFYYRYSAITGLL